MVELFAPAEYWDSPVKSAFCNGCGAKGLGGWLVPDTLYGLDIEECCSIHDFQYAMGKTIADKESADRTFLNNMLRVIDTGSQNFILMYLRRQRAMSYYSAVCFWGGVSFWMGKNRPEEMQCVQLGS